MKKESTALLECLLWPCTSSRKHNENKLIYIFYICHVLRILISLSYEQDNWGKDVTTNYIIYIILVVFAMNDPFVTHIVGYQKNILSVLFSNVIFVVSIQKLYCIWYFKNCFLFMLLLIHSLDISEQRSNSN